MITKMFYGMYLLVILSAFILSKTIRYNVKAQHDSKCSLFPNCLVAVVCLVVLLSTM